LKAAENETCSKHDCKESIASIPLAHICIRFDRHAAMQTKGFSDIFARPLSMDNASGRRSADEICD